VEIAGQYNPWRFPQKNILFALEKTCCTGYDRPLCTCPRALIKNGARITNKVPGRTRHEPTRITPGLLKPKKNISTLLIRSGGVPSGAAAFIFFGGMESQPPKANPGDAYFPGNSPPNFHPVCLGPLGIMPVFIGNHSEIP
jgi:hypothetical protein